MYRILTSLCLPVLVLLAGCSFTPVMVTDATGPDKLLTNEDGEFAAAVNIDATQPVETMWDFGDGTSSDGLVARHSFAEPGTYQVKFEATNKKRRKSGADEQFIAVEVSTPISPPSIITIAPSTTDPDTRTNVSFTANVRGDERESVGYTWNFGDETSSTDAQPSHTFSTPGTYTVTLRAANSAGSDSRTTVVSVKPYESPLCRNLADLNTAYYDRNSSILLPEATAAITENASILAECSAICVSVIGFAAPGERRVESLAAARAQAVVQFYLDNGVPSTHVSTGVEVDFANVSRKDGMRLYQKADSVPMRCAM